MKHVVFTAFYIRLVLNVPCWLTTKDSNENMCSLARGSALNYSYLLDIVCTSFPSGLTTLCELQLI